MRVTLQGDDHLVVSVNNINTIDDEDQTLDIASITTNSVLFTFDHGWIRVEGDSVTVCPYVNGKKGQEQNITLSDLVRTQARDSEPV